MTHVLRVSLLATTLGAGACAGRPAPVPLSGSLAGVQALAGAWAGEYTSDGLGRSGSLTFTLAAKGDTARGDVIMIPRGLNQPLYLTITFVRVAGDHVNGALAPYGDPECGCTLYTSFVGRLAGSGISGSFASLNGTTGTMRQTGTWEVVRQRAP